MNFHSLSVRDERLKFIVSLSKDLAHIAALLIQNDL